MNLIATSEVEFLVVIREHLIGHCDTATSWLCPSQNSATSPANIICALNRKIIQTTSHYHGTARPEIL